MDSQVSFLRFLPGSPQGRYNLIDIYVYYSWRTRNNKYKTKLYDDSGNLMTTKTNAKPLTLKDVELGPVHIILMFSLTKHISLTVYLYLIPAKRQGNLAKFWEARRGDVFWPSMPWGEGW